MVNKGFTLIEVMIVMVIISILVVIGIGAHEKASDGETSTRDYNINAPQLYIENDRRTEETVKLFYHSDGSLWACKEKSLCYEVR